MEDNIFHELTSKTIADLAERSLSSIWDGLVKSGRYTKSSIQKKYMNFRMNIRRNILGCMVK
ncbi:MAG: hypothetical protein IPP32_02905 [Bacteroidetes bacterium]|nr:hypothetical protein [Bacteroidota bacterium]